MPSLYLHGERAGECLFADVCVLSFPNPFVLMCVDPSTYSSYLWYPNLMTFNFNAYRLVFKNRRDTSFYHSSQKKTVEWPLSVNYVAMVNYLDGYVTLPNSRCSTTSPFAGYFNLAKVRHVVVPLSTKRQTGPLVAYLTECVI